VAAIAGKFLAVKLSALKGQGWQEGKPAGG
jgi:hypothetical protein